MGAGPWQQAEQHKDLGKEVRKMLRKAFLAGFNISGEGYNSDYPFDEKDNKPQNNSDWRKKRNSAVNEIIKDW